MSNNSLFNRLSIKTGLFSGGGAILLLCISAFFLFDITFSRELSRIHNNLQQVVKTVEHSAQVAVYLDNQQLASEITGGLIINDNVTGVILESYNGMQVKEGVITYNPTQRLVRVTLMDPFTPELPLGELVLIPNQKLIQKLATERSLFHIMLFGINTILIIVLVIVLVNRLLTYPLKNLALQLHDIKPGNPGKLKCPEGHKHDEIGLLVKDSNALLSEVRTTISQKNDLLHEIQGLERKFRLLFDNAKVGIALINTRGVLAIYNPAFAHTIGEEALSYILLKRHSQLLGLIKEKRELVQTLNTAMQSTAPLSLNITAQFPDLGERHLQCIFSKVEEGGEALIEVVIYDVSESVLREQKAIRDSEIDALTGIYNRRAGERIIRHALQSINPQTSHALLLIDLDKFKPINDTYGHEAGDKVLIEVASRFSSTTRINDLVARWGGDEFLIFISDTPENIKHSCTRIAEHLLQLVQQDIDLGNGNRGKVGLSIGITISPEHGSDLEQLTKNADTSMYKVKNEGRNNFAFYSEP